MSLDGTIIPVLLGSGGVGKSAMTERFLSNQFLFEYYPTIEDSYITERDIDGERHRVHVLDSPGQEEYIALRERFIGYGDGFLLVYDITRRSSFNELDDFYQEIIRVRDCDSIPCVVV